MNKKNNTLSVITLENMEFYAFHGCLEHEKTIGNTFLVSLKMRIDTQKAGESDCLEDTLNYKEVYDCIKEEMGKPVNLLEHLLQRMVDALSLHFPQILGFKIKLSKLAPPLGAKVEMVSIETTREWERE